MSVGPKIGLTGVEGATRRVIEKATERSGKTTGRYLNKDIREFFQEQLILTRLPTASVASQN